MNIIFKVFILIFLYIVFLYIVRTPVFNSINTINTINTINKFKLNPDFIEKNIHNEIQSFYEYNYHHYYNDDNDDYNIDDTLPISSKLNIGTMNIHFMESINAHDSHIDAINEIFIFMKKYKLNVLGIQEYSQKYNDQFLKAAETHNIYVGRTSAFYTNNKYDKNNKNNKCDTCNIVLSDKPFAYIMEHRLPNYDAFKKRTVLIFHYDNIKFAVTHLEILKPETAENKIKTTKIHIPQLRFIMDKNPDIIMGDMNFNKASGEYKFMLNNNWIDSNKSELPTTPFDTFVDFIFYKQNNNIKRNISVISKTAINLYTDHRPVIGYVAQ